MMRNIALVFVLILLSVPGTARAFDINECFRNGFETMFDDPTPENIASFFDVRHLTKRGLGKNGRLLESEVELGRSVIYDLLNEQSGSWIPKESVDVLQIEMKPRMYVVWGDLIVEGAGEFSGRYEFKVYIRRSACRITQLEIGGQLYSLQARMFQELQRRARDSRN